MYFFLKYIVTLFYKKLRIKIVVRLLRESAPWLPLGGLGIDVTLGLVTASHAS